MAMDSDHLKGKAALVTRAASGVGRAVALRLARDGADIVLHHEQNEDGARTTAAEIEAMGRRVVIEQADLRDRAAIRKLFDSLEGRWERLDLLVHSAGHGASGPLMELTDDAWQSTLQTNVTAMLALTQGIHPWLKRAGGGNVLAISNEGSRTCFSGYGAGGTAKAALEALCRQLAFELVHDGIRVNAICVGPVQTPGNAELGYPPAVYAFAEEKSPQGRMLRPDDLAGTISFLCCDDASWILGQTLVIDGGLMLGVDFRDWLD